MFQKDHGLLEALLLITNLVHVPTASGETPIHLACKLGLEGACVCMCVCVCVHVCE